MGGTGDFLESPAGTEPVRSAETGRPAAVAPAAGPLPYLARSPAMSRHVHESRRTGLSGRPLTLSGEPHTAGFGALWPKDAFGGTAR